MSGAARLAVVVLAAGQSRRFGAANKLLAQIAGKPLARHVTTSLVGLPRAFGVVVTRNRNISGLFRSACFRIVVPEKAGTHSESLRAGLRYAERHGASHVLLLLADMPGIKSQYLKEMSKKIGIHPVISEHNKTTRPPALIPRSLYRRLLQLRGDRGAAAILRSRPDLIRLTINGAQARDVDLRMEIGPSSLKII